MPWQIVRTQLLSSLVNDFVYRPACFVSGLPDGFSYHRLVVSSQWLVTTDNRQKATTYVRSEFVGLDVTALITQ
ncbi:MAG: hypothetical protein F6K28_17510 [Microcoleus sp. SIO2G3]|nr:hypothetical protein [Microcoleus sp. SIO2G3]